MYEFFCASLPELSPGTPPPLGVEEFDLRAEAELSPRHFAVLKCDALHPAPAGEAELPGVYARYVRFERYLRDRMARRRADRAGESVNLPDPEEYFQTVDFRLGAVFSADNPAEREALIDRIRWDYLDELEEGHFFDFDFVCVYRLKTMLLTKLRGRSVEAGKVNFDAAVESIE